MGARFFRNAISAFRYVVPKTGRGPGAEVAPGPEGDGLSYSHTTFLLTCGPATSLADLPASGFVLFLLPRGSNRRTEATQLQGTTRYRPGPPSFLRSLPAGSSFSPAPMPSLFHGDDSQGTTAETECLLSPPQILRSCFGMILAAGGPIFGRRAHLDTGRIYADDVLRIRNPEVPKTNDDDTARWSADARSASKKSALRGSMTPSEPAPHWPTKSRITID